MAQTYSTLRREAANGRVYSSQYSSVTAVPPLRRGAEAPAPVRQMVPAPAVPEAVPQAVAPAVQAPVPAVTAPAMEAVAPQAPPAEEVQTAPFTPAPAVLQAAAAIAQSLGFQPAASQPGQVAPAVPGSRKFNLSSSGLPPAAHIAPGGPSGTLTVTARPDGGHSVSGIVQGVRTLTDPVLRPVAWLIHDLTVPYDLSPTDLAALPRGSAGTGNQPGAVFTIDGNTPTYTPACNTVSICISPGGFKLEGNGTWTLDGRIDAGTNLTFHPLVFLGPGALADINAPVPSGTSARILTDLFMRPASVHPELNGRSQFSQRLMAIARDVLGNAPPPAFLTPDRFTRAAVAIEGLVRSTPSLMPSRETTFLLANQSIAG